MKTIVNCLREFAGLKEAEQPIYMYRMGAALTTNTLIFPDIPYAGSVITTHAGTLGGLLALKDSSDTAMSSYLTELATCVQMVEKNYDDIDLVAQGDAEIVAKAGVRGTSVNTTRTGSPSVPENLKYAFADNAGEMLISYDADKLAYGAVIVTYTDEAITVVKSGNTQLKITTPEGKIIFVDISTTIKTTIQNLLKKSEIMSVVALFNPNGISPVASPSSVVVPK